MSRIAGRLVVYLPADLPPGTRVAGRTLRERFLALGRALDLHVDWVGPDGPASAGGRVPAEREGVPSDKAGVFDPGGPVLMVAADAVFVTAVARHMLAGLPRPSVARFSDGAPALLCVPGGWIGRKLPESLLQLVQSERWRAAEGTTVVSIGESTVPNRRLVFSLRRRDTQPWSPREASPGARAATGVAIDAASIAEAEQALLASLENPRDGLFDRVLNRHVSKRWTARLLATRLTPNQVTISSLVVGGLGALAISANGRWWPLAGALLFQLSAVLDCVDGEIARARFEESEWGEWLDISADTLTHILIFAGIAGHVLPVVGSRAAWALASSFALGGLAAFGVVTWAERTEQRWKTLPDRRARWLAGLLQALTTRDLSVLVLGAAAAGLLPELLYGAAVGAHVFWIVVLVLHRGLLARAAEVSEAEQRRMAA